MVKLPFLYLSYFQHTSSFFPLASLIALSSAFNHHTGHRKSFSRLAGICTPVCPYTLHYTVKISGPNSGRNLISQFNGAWPVVGACCLVCILFSSDPLSAHLILGCTKPRLAVSYCGIVNPCALAAVGCVLSNKHLGNRFHTACI
jgi:hypothetical protein